MADGIRGKICSCPKAKQSKCAHPYFFNFGQKYRFSVDVQAGQHVETKGEAEALGREWLKQIRDGVFVRRERGAPALAPVAGDVLTLAQFADIYLRDCSMLKAADRELKDRQHADYYIFQPLLAFRLPDGRVLGQQPFASVDERMYELYVADRREQDYAASTVNKDVTLITAMCKWAARRKYFGPYGVNPISDESRILVRKSHAQRHRPVTDDELVLLRPQADPILWAFIELALITCLRLTELYRLKWSDYKGLYLQVRKGATKVETAARWAPLDDRGVAILEFLRVNPAGEKYPDTDFIFGQCGEEPTDINDRFNTMLLKAYTPGGNLQWVNGDHGPLGRRLLDQIDLIFGDFRHEGALRKYRAGWTLNEIQLLLGHTNLVQTSTYLGLGKEEVLRAMARQGAGAKVPTEIEGCNPRMQSDAIRAPKQGKKQRGKQVITH
jgi:integrase